MVRRFTSSDLILRGTTARPNLPAYLSSRRGQCRSTVKSSIYTRRRKRSPTSSKPPRSSENQQHGDSNCSMSPSQYQFCPWPEPQNRSRPCQVHVDIQEIEHFLAGAHLACPGTDGPHLSLCVQLECLHQRRKLYNWRPCTRVTGETSGPKTGSFKGRPGRWLDSVGKADDGPGNRTNVPGQWSSSATPSPDWSSSRRL